jgi:protein phosphatase
VKLSINAASNVGCVRENNEDMVLLCHQFVRDGELACEADLSTSDRCIVALADGMGGHSCGEVASSEVLHNLDYVFNDLPKGLGVEDFNEAIYEWMDSINAIIASKGHADPSYRQMGTTLVALAYYNGEFYWMNCGDSRIYRFHDGYLQQMSTDHSLNNLTGSNEHSNLITNCIGGGCTTSYIDMVKCTNKILPGDVFMLCSDGLTDMVDDIELEKLLKQGATASELCQAAVTAGGFDNVSVCMIKIV